MTEIQIIISVMVKITPCVCSHISSLAREMAGICDTWAISGEDTSICVVKFGLLCSCSSKKCHDKLVNQQFASPTMMDHLTTLWVIVNIYKNWQTIDIWYGQKQACSLKHSKKIASSLVVYHFNSGYQAHSKKRAWYPLFVHVIN